MDLNSNKIKFTSIVKKYPTYRDSALKACWGWLEGRRVDDNAEGLWRIHDKIYNLNDFIKNHPGGSEWIKLTKGTDITEAFESYHVLPKASLFLNKFYVKDADEPRNYNLTFEEKGFYRTLKSRVAEKLPKLDRSDLWKSKFYLDLIVCGFLLGSIMAVRVDNMIIKTFFILLASQCVGWLNAAAHNFTHQRNNWRMYTLNLILIGWRDWRVFHGMSHHLYPNSYVDLEVSGYEPFIMFLPVKKRSLLLSYLSILITYPAIFHKATFSRFAGIFYSKPLHWDEILILLPPSLMILFSNQGFTFSNLQSVFIIWNVILLLGSTFYSIMALSAGHHGVSIVHEGDEFKDLDFGFYQIAATVDRVEASQNLPMALTHFGDHILHHLFPSLDQALLPQLRETLIETCKEFEVEYRKWTLFRAFLEEYKQLSRTKLIRLDVSEEKTERNGRNI